MELVLKKGADIPTPLVIRSHRSEAVLGVVEQATADESGRPVLGIAFAANLAEISEGLTPEEVIKVFDEAGITVTALPPAPEAALAVTELPDQGNGFLRVEIIPEEHPAPPEQAPKGKKHLKPVDSGPEKPSKPSLF
jgi:hypothetical protein